MRPDSKILTAAEELALHARWRAGDARAADRLIVSNQRLVHKIARRYMRSASLDDLVQEGNVGLMLALEKFDPTRGIRFMSYAAWWVRALMQEFARRAPSVVRMPAKAEGRYRPYAAHDASLDEPAYAGDEHSRLDGLAADGDGAEASGVSADEARAVRAALWVLSRREREVIRRRHLSDDKETLKQIGEDHGLSRERVRQLEERALAKLRARLAA